jgi:hypothetical protein
MGTNIMESGFVSTFKYLNFCKRVNILVECTAQGNFASICESFPVSPCHEKQVTLRVTKTGCRDECRKFKEGNDICAVFVYYSIGACKLIITSKDSDSLFLCPLPDSDNAVTYLCSPGKFDFLFIKRVLCFSFKDMDLLWLFNDC